MRSPARLCLSLTGLLLAAACATPSEAGTSQGGAAAAVGAGSGGEVPPPAGGRATGRGTVPAQLVDVQRELLELKGDITELEGRVGSALSAVNWNLMRYPHCVDSLFETSARLDLGRQRLAAEQAALQKELDEQRAAWLAGRGDYEAVIRLENRVQHNRDQVTILNAELAHLFTKTMRRESPCGEP